MTIDQAIAQFQAAETVLGYAQARYNSNPNDSTAKSYLNQCITIFNSTVNTLITTAQAVQQQILP